MDHLYPTSSNVSPTTRPTVTLVAPSSVNPIDTRVSVPCNVLVLPLEHFESRDYFQQMLSIDSAIEALAAAKHNLLAEAEHVSRTSSPDREDELRGAGVDDIVALETLKRYQHGKPVKEIATIRQSIASLDTLARTFEELLETARRNHTHSARLSLQGKTWNFPTEILEMIFNNLRPFVNTKEKTVSFAEDEHDIATIHAIRRTCKRFYDASSHLLVRRLDILPDKVSLGRLERVMRDQSKWRADQVLRIDMRCYSHTLANDFEAFANLCSERLDNKVHYFDDLLLDLQLDLDGEAVKTAGLRRTAQRREELQLGWLSRDTIEDGVDQGRDIIESWRDIHHNGLFLDVSESDEAVVALWEGYQQYRKLWQEQQEFLWGDGFARRVAMAVAATGSKVWLNMSDGGYSHWDLNGYDTSRQFDEHGPSDLNLFADPVKLVEHIMLRPRPWWLTDLNARRLLAPRSLLYQLPLALRAAGAQMAGLTIDLTKWPLWPRTEMFRPTGDHLLDMEQTINDPSVVCSFRLSRSPGLTRPGWLERHGYRPDSDDMLEIARLDDPGLLSLFRRSIQATFHILYYRN